MVGIYTAMLASKKILTEEEFQKQLPFVIREVKERGGYGFHGANEFGDIELSATYMRAISEEYVERIERQGFFHGLGQTLKICPGLQLTPKGLELYETYKALEVSGKLEPNRYFYFLSD